VRRSIEVNAPQAKAFEVFARKTSAWWPKSHHVGKSALVEAIIEPKVNGRWYERGDDAANASGAACSLESARRAHARLAAQRRVQVRSALVTEVEVKFVPLAANRTRVELEHRLLERWRRCGEGQRPGRRGRRLDSGAQELRRDRRRELARQTVSRGASSRATPAANEA
jgi:hypothetical protein